LAFHALLVSDDECDNEALLEDGSRNYFPLDSETDLQPHRVWLRPNPGSVHQPHPPRRIVTLPLLQPRNIRQTQRHQLTTLQLATDPLPRLLMPPRTPTALMQRGLSGNSTGDVGLGGEACGTGVGGIGGDGDAADAAKYCGSGSTGGRLEVRVLWEEGVDCMG